MTASPFPPAQFQSFEEKADPAQVAPRLAALRKAMVEADIDAFLIPRADAHRGESVPPSEARLAYVTGFTGSAGMAIVGTEKAALFVDSRYTLQAPAQTDVTRVDVIEVQGGISAEINRYVRAGGRLAYDPWLHTPAELRDLADKLAGHAEVVPHANLVDLVWQDRPAPPLSPVEFLGHNRSGRTAQDKIAYMRDVLVAEGADAVALTLPESICWLFNMRGRDVPNTPLVLGFAIVPVTGQPILYLDAAKITPELLKGLDGVADIAATSDLDQALAALGKAGKAVIVDPQSAPAAIAARLKDSGARVIEKRDPVLGPKSRKNDVELSGMREAHRLDGIAMAKFLSWFDEEASKGELTEIGIVTALEAFRREEATCIDASFDTISGAGPNGAIVHYRVTTGTDRRLAAGELMLVDSGAQYLSGTTDITRTLFTGAASAEQKDRYTRVLKGMIAISMARFPKGTTGAQIDILARQFLWQSGITYNHGTGHGVGAFLGVHEGPVGIAPRYTTPLEVGNVLSNEPGYYKAGEYGIRIENLVVVRDAEQFPGYLDFETITLAPIDTRLIDMDLLSQDERNWLNGFHARVLAEIGPLVDGKVKDWLTRATAAI
ncbi:aminopeptidase P family protein [Devosia chinhatensis]|uniref:X-Pro aminopeptidase n=1 Tax=Devosia chinhatensis TaxID=429727 RepID=A0A0F5FMD6_9HYPH|nr:aminopeptidase P family protein [Devosia chinhatensis]KKB09988.1 X-Pro aminopeptidase [Devosia chinhatensis]